MNPPCQPMHLSSVLAFEYRTHSSILLVSRETVRPRVPFWRLSNLFAVGVYTSGPVWGRIVDRKGPRIPLISSSILLLVGYLGIKQMYDDGIGNGATVSPVHLTLLVMCSIMTGLGGNAGLGAAMNATAKSFSATAVCTFFSMSIFVLT